MGMMYLPEEAILPDYKPDFPVEHAPAQNLVSSWIFNESAGNALDLLGQNTGAAVGSPPRIATAEGRAVTLNGTSQYFNLGNPQALQILGKIGIVARLSVSAWPTSGNASAIAAKAYDGTRSGYFFQLNNISGVVHLEFGSYDSGAGRASWVISGWNLNDVHTVGGYYDGVNWSVFFDGVLKATGAATVGAVTTAAPCAIGAASVSGSFTQFLAGTLYYCDLYNSVLSPAHFANIAATGYAANLRPKQRDLYLAVSGGGTISLILADMAHAHAADALALSQINNLAAADALHAQSAGNVSLGVVYALVAQDGLHAHLADALALSQNSNLALADSLHAQTAEALTLTQTHLLALADGLHAQSADNAALTQAQILALADALHAHAADNISLSGIVQLVLADGLHAQTADNATLMQTHLLALADALHGHGADNLSLSGAVQLVLGDSLHAQTAGNATLTQAQLLALADALHAHNADSLTLSPGYTLAIADAVHAALAESLALTQQHVLIISDALHALLADTAFFTTIPTPDSRVLIVRGENRVLIVAREERTLTLH